MYEFINIQATYVICNKIQTPMLNRQCCLILVFMMCHTFSRGDGAGPLAGHSRTCAPCLWSHTVVTCAEWGTNIVLMAAYVSNPNIYTSTSMVPSHICESPMHWTLMHPVLLALALFADNSFRCWVKVELAQRSHIWNLHTAVPLEFLWISSHCY